jgi:hypothetical protein
MPAAAPEPPAAAPAAAPAPPEAPATPTARAGPRVWPLGRGVAREQCLDALEHREVLRAAILLDEHEAAAGVRARVLDGVHLDGTDASAELQGRGRGAGL